ncbi:MAG: hypothetical protein IPG42_00345 [Betaproteobacteria bacterium]|nr:hypothetical protein [Betaproteobacteria bacterium]
MHELDVPEAYYNHLTLGNIEAVKNTATQLRDSDGDLMQVSWPRLISLVVYGEFHKECEQWQAGNPIPEQLFIRLGIKTDVIAKELDRDPQQVIYGACFPSKTKAEVTTDESIEALIVRCAESRNTEFSYPNLPYDKISDFASSHNCDCEWFPAYGGMRFWVDIYGGTYAVNVKTIDALKEGKSGVAISVRKRGICQLSGRVRAKQSHTSMGTQCGIAPFRGQFL